MEEPSPIYIYLPQWGPLGGMLFFFHLFTNFVYMVLGVCSLGAEQIVFRFVGRRSERRRFLMREQLFNVAGAPVEPGSLPFPVLRTTPALDGWRFSVISEVLDFLENVGGLGILHPTAFPFSLPFSDERRSEGWG